MGPTGAVELVKDAWNKVPLSLLFVAFSFLLVTLFNDLMSMAWVYTLGYSNSSRQDESLVLTIRSRRLSNIDPKRSYW